MIVSSITHFNTVKTNNTIQSNQSKNTFGSDKELGLLNSFDNKFSQSFAFNNLSEKLVSIPTKFASKLSNEKSLNILA